MERANGVNRFMGRRPLALFAGMYALGALAAYYGHVPPVLWTAAAGICLVALTVLRKRVWVFLLALFVGAALTGHAAIVPDATPRQDAMISGRVSIEPRSDDIRTVLTISDVTINGEAHPHPLRLYAYGEPTHAQLGDWINTTGDTWLPQGQRNPGGFDFRRFLWTRGGVLCATINRDTLEVNPELRLTPAALVGRVRAALGESIDRLFPEHAPLVRALVMGDKNGLPDALTDDFRAAGIAHLLAISGLHVSCLAFALEALLRAARMSRKWAFWITSALLLLYAVLIGFPSSVVRAGIMFIMLRGSALSGRPPDTLTSLAAAFLLIVLVRPLSVADAGFQLSFSAVLGMLLLTEPIKKLVHAPGTFLWPGFKRPRQALRWAWAGVAALLCTSVAIQLFTLPVLAQTFGAVTPLAPLVNLCAIPLTTLLLPLVVLKICAGSVAPMLVGGIWRLPDMLLSLLSTLANRAARIPGSSVSLPGWPFLLVVVYLAVCVLASPYVRIGVRWRKLTLLALPMLMLCSIGIAQLRLPGGLNIAFLDAGQADAMVVRAEGRAYLVDVGKQGGPVDGYLAYTGQSPEAVFLTHPHADHAGGLGTLLDRMPPKTIYLPECWDQAQSEGDVAVQLQRAEAMGIGIERLSAGDVVELSEKVRCEVLQPEEGYQPLSGNGASLVLRIVYGDGSALLTGDLPAAEEMSVYPDVDLLKAAHHGSGSSTSEGMLRLSSPSVLVVSVGRNSYGQPAERVIQGAQNLGATVYRTDQCGAVFAQVDADGTVYVRTFLHPEESEE